MSELAYHPPLHGPDVLEETADWLVVSKPAGLLSVPGRAAEHRDSAVTRLQHSHGPIWVVHRLDMATSGLLILARSPEAAASLGRLFERRQVRKHYVAVVSGAMQADSGEINLPLICDWPRRPLQKVCHETGKPSRTRYTVLKREADRSRVQLEPITGRSHQLRVHLSAIGHPILGDEFYAPDAVRSASPRLMLHAQRLELPNPQGRQDGLNKTGGPGEAFLCFESPPPF